MRVNVIDVPDQDCISKDNVSVKVNAVLYFKVTEADRAVIKVEDYLYAVSQLAQTTMRNVVGATTLDQLLSSRDEINKKIEELNKKVQEIGTKIYQEAAAKQAGQKKNGPDHDHNGHNHNSHNNNDPDSDEVSSSESDDNIVDAEFKEKKDSKKK